MNLTRFLAPQNWLVLLWVEVFLALCSILAWLRAKTAATLARITVQPRSPAHPA